MFCVLPGPCCMRACSSRRMTPVGFRLWDALHAAHADRSLQTSRQLWHEAGSCCGLARCLLM